MQKKQNYNRLKELAYQAGAVLFGVAALSDYKPQIHSELECQISELPYGISMGIELSRAVLDTITEQPTLIYSWHYRQINSRLDQMVLSLSQFIQAQNYLSLPIAASQVVDWENQKAHLSHKHLAQAAGLGWIGRNNLLVNKKFGSAIRLVSILTNMPLVTDTPVGFGCGDCYECLAVCPTQAIEKENKDFRYRDCFEKLKQFSRLPQIKYYICGVCVKVCAGKR